MNKKEFINELKKNLKGLSKEDKDEIIEDYEAHFLIGKKKKRKETEIAKALGSPKQIAKQAKLELLISNAEKQKSVKNITKVILATIGLSFFNLVFILGPFFAILSVIIALFATGFAISVAGLALSITAFLPVTNLFYIPAFNPLTIFFAGLGLLSLGILFCIGVWYLAKGFYILTIKYVKLNIKVIKS